MARRGERDGGKERFWRRMQQLWRRSGLSVRAFCAEHGLAEPSFYAWRRGVEPQLAQELVSFVPMAFGREVVEQLGVKCSDNYLMHNMLDDSEKEMPLAMEMAFAWAKGLIGEYRNSACNEIFKLIAGRSAELDAVNNALNGGVTVEGLKECKLGPSVVHLRRAVSPR